MLNQWRRARTASRTRHQAGFTLVELTVVITLLMLVLGALLGGLDSLTRAERTTSTRVDDEQAVRLTLAQLARDLRDANPVQVQPTQPGYASTADVLLDGSPPVHVQWAYDPVGHTLTRFVFAGATKQPSAVLAGVSATSFTWFDAAGNDLAAQPWATPADVARCAVELSAVVTLAPHRGAAPTTQRVQVQLANQGPFTGCR